MSRLALYLLGSPRIELDGEPLHIGRSKAVALLAYLAVERRQHRRDALTTLLWPDFDRRGARADLRRHLSVLNRMLREQLLTIDRETAGLGSDAEVWLDVADFRQRLSACEAHDHRPAEACRECLAHLEAAVTLYRDDFMAGFTLPDAPAFDEWQRYHTEGLRDELASALQGLVAWHDRQGECETAIAYARRWLALDPLRESAHRSLMALYAGAGHRSAALRQYRACVRALEQELSIPPSTETTALYERIRAEEEVLPVQRSGEDATPPHNLPLQLSSFIEREREVGEVAELLDKQRLVTLTGSGGVGKTRLALRAAEEALEGFPNGVWFAELAGLGDPELVPRTIVAALGLQESPNRSLLDQLKDYAREKQLLIVLDNCEHVIADCARIADALLRACPKLKILASSREALSVAGEVAYHVPSLSAPDPRELPPLEALSRFAAVQLFAERAAAVNLGFEITADNAQAVAQVCQRLDGIPLAIELAAARVGALSVAQIAARLDNRFRLLIGGSRTALPRQQTLRASIDWSYSLLDETERLLLMRLSVFQGGWTLELASEVCGFEGLDEFDVLDGLTQLVNKSLVHTVKAADGTNRYRRLETIRQYAREKLLDSGASEAVRDRHLDALLHLVEMAEPHLRSHGQVEWLDRLEVELDNLRVALEWALEGDALKGLRLATSIYWFWHIRGYRVEGEHWLRQLQERLGEGAPAVSASDVDLALLATARARQALLQLAIGRWGVQTARTAEEALALAEQLGAAGKPIQVMALHALAWNASRFGQFATIYELHRQRLEIAEELGDRFLIAESLQSLTRSEPDQFKAMEYAEQNLALRRELGDLDGLMTAQRFMGDLHFLLGDIIQAKLLYKEAIRTARTVKNRWGLASTTSVLGRILYESGEPDQAIEHFLQGLTFAHDLGEQAYVIWALCALGYAFGLKEDWPEAERYFRQAIDISRTNQSVFWEVTSCISLAEVAWTRGDVELAVQYYHATVDIGQCQGDLSLEGPTAYAAGKAALLRGDLRSAREFFRAALKDYAQGGYLNYMEPCLESLAVCAAQAGRFERAIRLHGITASRRWLKHPNRMPWLISYDMDTLLAPARAALDEARYEQLFQEGQAMSLEQGVAYALEVNDE